MNHVGSKRKVETANEKLPCNASLWALFLCSATGNLNAGEVQQYAIAAQASGASGWGFGSLASLDIARAFFKDMVSPEPVMVSIVVRKQFG